jgi:hypothetical protein
MATIKITSGNGFVLIDGGLKVPKGTFPVTPLKNGMIRVGSFRDAIKLGHFSDFLDTEDVPFASQQAAMDYLQGICGRVGGSGISSPDVSSIVLTTQVAYDALDPKVSTTLYLIPEA